MVGLLSFTLNPWSKPTMHVYFAKKSLFQRGHESSKLDDPRAKPLKLNRQKKLLMLEQITVN